MAKTESCNKDMSRYSCHSITDAHLLAEWLTQEATNTIPQIRIRFKETSFSDLFHFECSHEETIATLLKRPDSQRPALFRRFQKDHGEEALETLLVIGIIVSLRISDLVDARDAYRGYLVPGAGYRVTTKALYEHSRYVVRASLEYEWPMEVFINIDVDDEDESDEDFDLYDDQD